MDVKELVKEIEEERSIRIKEIKRVTVGSSAWFYLEGAITNLANLLYFYSVNKEE